MPGEEGLPGPTGEAGLKVGKQFYLPYRFHKTYKENVKNSTKRLLYLIWYMGIYICKILYETILSLIALVPLLMIFLINYPVLIFTVRQCTIIHCNWQGEPGRDGPEGDRGPHGPVVSRGSHKILNEITGSNFIL